MNTSMLGTPERPVVFLSYGLGKHSTAATVELIENPARRDFDLDQLILVTAMTGDEWESTREHVRTYLLPLLRAHHIRYVQLARNGPSERDGITVLSDTDRPTELFADGVYKLSDEMLTSGVVPSVCGTRKCSLKFKGWVLGQWEKANLAGLHVRKIIGFHAGEQYRVKREERFYTGKTSPIEHPLIRWGWTDETCIEYLRDRFGIEWKNSACDFCMFAGGKPAVIERYRAEPMSGAKAVRIERTARAINPRITLFSRRSVEDLLRADGNTAAIEAADRVLAAQNWKLMRVRRIRYSKTVTHRRTETLACGTRAAMDEHIRLEAESRGLPLILEAGHARIHLRRIPEATPYPHAEEVITVAPAIVKDKCRANFERRWHEIVTQTHLFHTSSIG
jgi:hypothetical protein